MGEETTAMRRPKMNRMGSVRDNIEKMERAITNADRARAYAHTTAATQINFSVLIEQWLVHMLFPISLRMQILRQLFLMLLMLQISVKVTYY